MKVSRFLRLSHEASTRCKDWLGGELAYSETILLAILYHNDGQKPSVLARELGLTRGRLTHMVDSLEDKDYIKRSPDPEDGRAFRIELTANGHKKGQEAAKLLLGLESALKETLGDVGGALLLEQLDKITRVSE